MRARWSAEPRRRRSRKSAPQSPRWRPAMPMSGAARSRSGTRSSTKASGPIASFSTSRARGVHTRLHPDCRIACGLSLSWSAADQSRRPENGGGYFAALTRRFTRYARAMTQSRRLFRREAPGWGFACEPDPTRPLAKLASTIPLREGIKLFYPASPPRFVPSICAISPTMPRRNNRMQTMKIAPITAWIGRPESAR
jgi:hypothetical protein